MTDDLNNGHFVCNSNGNVKNTLIVCYTDNICITDFYRASDYETSKSQLFQTFLLFRSPLCCHFVLNIFASYNQIRFFIVVSGKSREKYVRHIRGWVLVSFTVTLIDFLPIIKWVPQFLIKGILFPGEGKREINVMKWVYFSFPLAVPCTYAALASSGLQACALLQVGGSAKSQKEIINPCKIPLNCRLIN